MYLHQIGIYGHWNKAIYVEPLETYFVTFEVSDANTGEEIDDATITFNGKEYDPGEYQFEVVLGTYEYIVERDGYETVEGEVEVVDADVTVEVEIEPVATYTVTFIVTNNLKPSCGDL